MPKKTNLASKKKWNKTKTKVVKTTQKGGNKPKQVKKTTQKGGGWGDNRHSR